MISKEEASCIFYCEEFEEENVKTCMQNIQLSPDVDLCYNNDPNEPFLVCKLRIYGSPKCYKLYKSKEVLEQVQAGVEEAVNSDKKEDLTLGKDKNGSQIVEFLNYIYRPPEEDLFDSRYKPALVSDKDILSTVSYFTTKFYKKGPLGFSQWLSHQKLDLTAVKPQRKSLKTGNEIRIRKRQLNVLNDKYFLSVAENMLDVLPNHRSKINAMKKDGYKIVGYYRKSVAETGNRQQFLKRDLKNEDDLLSSLDDVHGNTVDFLQFLKENNKICVIAIDYAGLTTNMTDLKNLLKENASLKKMIINLSISIASSCSIILMILNCSIVAQLQNKGANR
ncbi:hypothetical protein INT48_001714 [Thamnidium elegans]|uniref:Uncharacterized protein n=1 Tax=Thamnidium elegans TaxID=101142 RepID=A0A8H7SFM4_9FUNG|nr:hypothetical protein INT48_001714 [Thamnidium elegans]